jgi:hypothetical protein
MAGRTPEQIDPHYQSTLRINRTTKVASAGSCFAQRISQALQNEGFNYLCTERVDGGYGTYSARYGNVYSALQMLQLLRRAYGSLQPAEPLWRLPGGTFVDPFRPAVQSGGFADEAACLWDRQSHLAAVRRVMEEADVFIFTLGLTETWCSVGDGAALPVCPGSALGGQFDPEKHKFINYDAAQVDAHLDAFILELQAVNPRAQVLLTVSPVPLLATFEPRHVLQATVYSKSVLRVVAEQAVRRHAHVHYFASYEIVNASGNSQAFFQDDLRSVSDTAVAHVIHCFHRQYTGNTQKLSSEGLTTQSPSRGSHVPSPMRSPLCDEDLVMAALAQQMQGEDRA